MTALARRLVGTRLGRTAKKARAALELFGSGLESIGTLANDHMAEILVTRLAERHFVDVGAHIGSVIAEVQAHCPKVKITAFEPIPEKAERLRALFSSVSVHECALSDREGRAQLFVNPRASGWSSLAESGGMIEITVPLRRLDEIVSDPDVVKIDVEGAELGVLRGCEALKSRPCYMFESGPAEVLNYTKADLWGWFRTHEYSVYLPHRLAHDPPPMSLDVFLDSHLYPRRTTNYFAVANEDVGRVRARARQIY